MTVHELIKILKSYHDKSAEVLVSSDPEGNNILDLHEVTEAFVNADGDIVHDEDGGQTKPILVLFPG